MSNIQKQKILITGANGFVGSNATIYFARLGAKVTAIVSKRAKQKVISKQLGSLKNSISLKRSDLLSPSEAVAAVKGQTLILHFAAIDGNANYKRRHSAEIFSKNIRMTLNMLDAAAKEKVKIFLLISSADIYSSLHHGSITEKSRIDIHFDKEVDGYKLAKWTSELAAKEFSIQYGIKVIILRPSNLYGPRDEFENVERMRVIPSIMRKLMTTKEPIVLWGKKKQIKSFLYIEDFLSICSFFIEHEVYDYPVNIVSKNYLTLEELSKKIIAISGRKRKIVIDRKKNIPSQSGRFNLKRLDKLIPNFKETDLMDGLKKTLLFYQKKYTGE